MHSTGNEATAAAVRHEIAQNISGMKVAIEQADQDMAALEEAVLREKKLAEQHTQITEVFQLCYCALVACEILIAIFNCAFETQSSLIVLWCT